ncbi:hypothetical protein [Novosphingobium sp.]|uniref:hypothetical protein n=1 Tax=Novosphingobium sp. TaxID=1874826 RepID=UPI00286DE3AD|nr:hypothetical protein [Novosphingobium sp.]
MSDAARVAGIGRSTAYDWRADDPEFAKAWDDAEQEAADKLEAEAWRRATVDKSDRMLEILLKAHRPDKFVEKRLIGSDPAHPLPPAISIDARQLSTEALREVTKALQAKS